MFLLHCDILSLGIQLFLISSELFFNIGYIPFDWVHKNTLLEWSTSLYPCFVFLVLITNDESFLYKLVTSVSLKILTFVLLLRCSSMSSCHLFGSFICFASPFIPIEPKKSFIFVFSGLSHIRMEIILMHFLAPFDKLDCAIHSATVISSITNLYLIAANKNIK